MKKIALKKVIKEVIERACECDHYCDPLNCKIFLEDMTNAVYSFLKEGG